MLQDSDNQPTEGSVTVINPSLQLTGKRGCVNVTESPASHSQTGIVQTNYQLNVPLYVGSYASVPAQRHVGVGFSAAEGACFQLSPVVGGGSMMGNRLSDCAVAGVSAAADSRQCVPIAMNAGSYRDCHWSPSGLRHIATDPTSWSGGQQLAPASDVNRPAWVGQQCPAAIVNGINAHHNYAANVYGRQACSQMSGPFTPVNSPTARLRAVNMPIPQLLMLRTQQQQQPIGPRVCQNSVSRSPVHSMSLVDVGQNHVSPIFWRSRFPKPSFTTAPQSVTEEPYVTAAARNVTPIHTTSVTSPTVSSDATPPNCSPAVVSVSDSSSAVRNNNFGRIYQLPPAPTTCQCETCVESSIVTCTHSSTSASVSASVITTTKSTISAKPAVISPSPAASQPDAERTYVAGRRYTVTMEDGVTVEGIWDGKYLTVPTSTSASSSASQTSG